MLQPKNAYDILFAHVALPDSLDQRLMVLRAFEQALKKHHPTYRKVVEQIRLIERLKALEKELPLTFMAQ